MRSKTNPVDQPERTTHYDCAMCIAEMLHNIIIIIIIIIIMYLFAQGSNKKFT